jgi:hypothetical protein
MLIARAVFENRSTRKWTRDKPLILIAHSQPRYARALPAAIPTTIGSRVVLLADHYVADVAARQIDDNQGPCFGDRVGCKAVR